MNETVRTSIFVAGAVISLIAAKVLGPSVPKAPAEFSQVGSLFYPDFQDADAAKSLQVVNYNADTATLRIFGVEQGPDGIWRIPSRNNYPVDGKERLGKTATSIIGIKRDALAGQRKSQHAEFGVLDPLSESVSDYQGVGNRVTLKDGKDGKTLADLIIGKEVKGRNGYFYVRNPTEDQTYIAKVSIDVSTKFADWIESDLLKLDGSKLRTINIDKHSVEFTPNGGKMTGKESNRLTRASSTDKWKLDEIDEATEEVNEEEVRKLVQALDDLKIVGVRPKNERLKKRLEDEEGLALDDRTRREMEEIGFYFVRLPDRKGMAMISQEGDLIAVTDQGVAYELHFGSVFTGSEDEVEAGFIKQSSEKTEGEQDAAAKAETDGTQDETNSKDPRKIKSRYLFAQAQFDVSALGPRPEPPQKPEEPSEDANADAGDPASPADADAAENVGEKPDPKKQYEEALARYDVDLKKYEADLKSYEDKVKAGEKQVSDLNRRFAEWYYVISGDSFENLRQGRKTLVKPKSAAEKTDGNPPPFNLGNPPGFPDGQPQ